MGSCGTLPAHVSVKGAKVGVFCAVSKLTASNGKKNNSISTLSILNVLFAVIFTWSELRLFIITNFRRSSTPHPCVDIPEGVNVWLGKAAF